MNSRNARVKTLSNLLSVCILFLCAASLALAQAGRGSISGLVTDPGGALIQGAHVTLVNPATGVTQHTVTTSAGLYTFISLNPGVYQVTASQAGFKSVTQDKITVNVDQVTEVNITLQVGAATETVTVTGGVFGRSIPVVPIRGIVASSETETASVSGLATAAERVVVIGRGPWTELPSEKRITGGVFPMVGSRKALISHSGLRLAGIDRVWPLLISVQVIFLVPKSAGTVMVKRPHCRPGRKCVGWPWSGPPGSIRLFGPSGISRSCF